MEWRYKLRPDLITMQERIREPTKLSADVVDFLVDKITKTEETVRQVQMELTVLKTQFPMSSAYVANLDAKIEAINLNMQHIIDRLNKLPEEEIKQITKAFNSIKLLLWIGSAILAGVITLSEYGGRLLTFFNMNPYK